MAQKSLKPRNQIQLKNIALDSSFLVSLALEIYGEPKNRGLNTLTIGAPRPIVDEHLTWAEEQYIEWPEPRFDLAESGKLGEVHSSFINSKLN